MKYSKLSNKSFTAYPNSVRVVLRCYTYSVVRIHLASSCIGRYLSSLGLLGICFWRKVREERIWAEYMREKWGWWFTFGH
jgi:hypothetical protein